jgi:histone-lysine N-methyltransferase SETMAR
MNKEHVRSYILIRYKLNIRAAVIHSELMASMGDSAPSKRTVERWVERFKSGVESVNDIDRIGRPITATNSSNVDRIRRLVEKNPRISIHYIEAETGLSYGTIGRILHDHLNLRKLSSRWIPHELNENQQKKRVEICRKNLELLETQRWRLCDIVTGDESWIYHRKIGNKASNSSWAPKGQSPQTVVKRNQFEPKSMVCVFIKTTGPVLVHVVPRGQSINNTYYVENVLGPLIETLKSQTPTSGTKNMKILHDNARPHVHENVKNFLNTNHMTIIDHPAYSPDLAPCDFWLFNEIKKRLPDRTSEELLESQITEILNSIPKEEFQRTFQKWTERMKLCIENQGNYFEHLKK